MSLRLSLCQTVGVRVLVSRSAEMATARHAIAVTAAAICAVLLFARGAEAGSSLQHFELQVRADEKRETPIVAGPEETNGGLTLL